MNELDDENEKNPEGGQAVNDARSDRREEEELISGKKSIKAA